MRCWLTLVIFGGGLSAILSPLFSQDVKITRRKQEDKDIKLIEREEVEENRLTRQALPSSDMYHKKLERIVWQRTLYRELDLSHNVNLPLIYKDRDEDLFTKIFLLLAERQIKAYEYVDGIEHFEKERELDFSDFLKRFKINYNSREDIPRELIKAYYVKERYYFDQATSSFGCRVQALCPILFEQIGEEEYRKPLFWLKYEDLRPFISDTFLPLTSLNEAMRGSWADYFDLNIYRGDIVKVSTDGGKSLLELSRTPDELKRRREEIELQIERLYKSISLPDTLFFPSKGKKKPKSKSVGKA